MHIHCFQHVAFETPGSILEWIDMQGHSISYTCFFEENSPFPTLETMDALLVLGGYMNVDEEAEFPWLKAEKAFIKQAIDAKKKVLGICLGSQLVASALGAKVFAGAEKEIGFLPIEYTEQALKNNFFEHFKNPYPVFHWHGDTYLLPENAVRLASSNATKNQGFSLHNHVLGLQFHIEMTEKILEDMLLHDGKELDEKGDFIQSIEEIRMNYAYLEQNKADLFLLLNKFFKA
jgi:GMP synthase-like glutamine amidotransferase